MTPNAMAIAIFCSHLCVGEDVKPLEPREWSILAQKLMQQNIQPSDLLAYSNQDFRSRLQLDEAQTERFLRLIDRSASLSFEISKYENMGIGLITRADAAYPPRLKKTLGNGCPPLFYYAGDLELLKRPVVGYVGSRTTSEADTAFTRELVGKTVGNGFGVVSGGAKGIDSVAQDEAIALGSSAIAYLSDSMLRIIKSAKTIQAIQQGTLLLLSVVKPDAGFNAGIAMMRNKYIYAQSSGTIVMKADYNKGGTWSGAMENLKNEWCATLCWNNGKYPGNQALIQKGAIPIEEAWDGDMVSLTAEKKKTEVVQISLFDA